jgi:hypothetical protein
VQAQRLAVPVWLAQVPGWLAPVWLALVWVAPA